MPEVTLTSFVDFVLANGTSRLTELRRIRRRFLQDYTRGMDYYREIRRGMQAFHRGDKDAIKRAVADAEDKQRENFNEVASCYAKFVRAAKPQGAFDPPRTSWSGGDLTVIVNPELGLVLPDGPIAVKLYFKAPEVSRRRADIVLHLMKESYEAASKGTAVALLDVRRNRLFHYRPYGANLDILLRGEAAAFCQMWDLLDQAA